MISKCIFVYTQLPKSNMTNMNRTVKRSEVSKFLQNNVCKIFIVAKRPDSELFY